jgi:mRNA interferase RelE/StbE
VPYRIAFLPEADRDFDKLTPVTRQRIAPRIASLAEDPRPHGVRKLIGSRSLYRIRVGDYRVIFEINDQAQLVTVIGVGHRREVYE